MVITRYVGRLGIVSPSRSGSTYFRRYLCNHYGVLDSKSWLKKNLYSNINNEKFTQSPHILKILPHYIIGETDNVLTDMPCVWLYRKDVVTQFMSHVARLRTKVNHITDIKDRPVIEDNSLVATYDEYERFQLKQIEFWQLHEKYGKEDLLVSYEDFLSSPDNIIEELNCWMWWDFYEKKKGNLTLTVPLGIMYKYKFENYTQIKEWFNER
jgi:hypothetical protein